MPWREVTVLNSRKAFVLEALGPNANMSELCRKYGISRKTGYKWLKRFKELGVAGLEDRSRRPKSHALSISAEVAVEIVRLKREHPSFGPKKIRRLLEKKAVREGFTVPSLSTVGRVLDRAQLRRKRQRRRKHEAKRAPRANALNSNDIWTVDFKGWWRTQDGQRVEPLTVRDSSSRYILSISVMTSIRTDGVRAEFERLFEVYGVPKAILTDNGSPFRNLSAPKGLTRLSAWWVSLGIDLLNSRPGKPQDNGAHERMHGDIAKELEAHPASTPEAQQTEAHLFREKYNYVRPHESLDMETPATHYHKSRRLLSDARARQLPYKKGWSARRVSSRGEISYKDRSYFISKSLKGFELGLQPTGEGQYIVYFYELPLGIFAPAKSNRLLPLE